MTEGQHDFQAVPGASVPRCRHCAQPRLWGHDGEACPKAPRSKPEKAPRSVGERFDTALRMRTWER